MDGLFSSETIGFAGVALLLLAFLLNILKVLKAESVSYLVLNFLGAGLAGLSSWLISFMPFVLLEGVWSLVAAVSLVRLLIKGRKAGPERTA
ncbi:CBU_0592 family membrane protein [Hypericibacter sp.]|uniref:CBU_0592 family membrane protein n=1 Tax=Hypericibacter sp. TaxID=2705401 RepID=UPI003D6D3C6C